jgi:putative peptidoglycan lipid II flippase
MKSKSIIGAAAILITLTSLIGRFIGFLREILFANYYGTNNEYDNYLVASIIPLTINTVSIFFFQNFFIPNYLSLKKGDSELSNYFAKKVFIASVLFSFFIVVIFLVFADQIVSAYTTKEIADDELVPIFKVFSLTIFPAIVSSFLMSYLNVQNKFDDPAYSLLFINIATVIALLIFKSENIILISYGYLVGSFLQLFYLIFKVNIKDIFLLKNNSQRSVLKFSFVSVLSILLVETIGQLYMIADRYFYSAVDTGGIAALNYATNIFLLPVSIFTFSLTTAIMPKISELFATDRLSDMALMLKKIISISLYFFLPVIVIFTLFGEQVVRIFFERGTFDTSSTQITDKVLFYLSLSLIFYVIYGVLNKYLYSLRRNIFLLKITVMIILVKILLNFSLVNHLKQDGLAISTSVSYLLFFTLAFVKIKAELKIKLEREIFQDLFFYLTNTLLSALLTVILSNIINAKNFIQDVFTLILFVSIYYFNNHLFVDKNQKLILEQIKFLRK